MSNKRIDSRVKNHQVKGQIMFMQGLNTVMQSIVGESHTKMYYTSSDCALPILSLHQHKVLMSNGDFFVQRTEQFQSTKFHLNRDRESEIHGQTNPNNYDCTKDCDVPFLC